MEAQKKKKNIQDREDPTLRIFRKNSKRKLQITALDNGIWWLLALIIRKKCNFLSFDWHCSLQAGVGNQFLNAGTVLILTFRITSTAIYPYPEHSLVNHTFLRPSQMVVAMNCCTFAHELAGSLHRRSLKINACLNIERTRVVFQDNVREQKKDAELDEEGWWIRRRWVRRERGTRRSGFSSLVWFLVRFVYWENIINKHIL